MERNTGIDFLKVLSVMGVVALHTQRSLETGICYNPFLYYCGRFAMPVFFMVNGYLILSKSEFSVAYWKKKTFRIANQEIKAERKTIYDDTEA